MIKETKHSTEIILKLLKEHPKLRIKELAKLMDRGEPTVGKHINKLVLTGEVIRKEERRNGTRYVYFLLNNHN